MNFYVKPLLNACRQATEEVYDHYSPRREATVFLQASDELLNNLPDNSHWPMHYLLRRSSPPQPDGDGQRRARS